MNRGDIKLIIDRCNAHDVPDAADLIESLRQQLAAMTAERDAYMRDYGNEQDRKREVAQKLANREKQIVMLRDGLKRADDLLRNSYDHVSPLIREALAATADLDGLILCEKKPVARKISYGSLVFLEGYAELSEGTPLYRAWEPK